METNKIKYLIILLFVSSQVFSQQLSLSRAVEISVGRSDKVKQYSEKVEQKKKSYNESKGNFLPSINLTGGFNHMNDDLVMDLDPIRQAMIRIQAGNQVEFANVYNVLLGGPGLTQQQRAALLGTYSSALSKQIPLFQSQVKKQDYWNATLTGTQPLFMGGKLLSAKNIAEQEIELAETELDKSRNEVISEVISNYLNAVLLKSIVSVRRDVLNGMIKHRNDAKRIYEEGIIAKNQYLRSEVAVAEAERNLSDDENRFNLAITALRNSLNYKDSEPIDVCDSLVFKELQEPLSNFKENAVSYQPVLKMIEIKKKQIEGKLTIDRSEFLPKFFLFGKYEILDKYLSILEPRWVVGIQGSINLFNGFKDYQRVSQTKHVSREIDYLESDTKSKLNLVIEKNYKDVQNSKTRYEKLEAVINLAEENLRLTEGRFLSGLCTSLDVIDARLVTEKNGIEKKLSLYEYYKSMNELYLTSGKPMNFLILWNKDTN